MRLPGKAQAVIDILDKLEQRPQPLSLALKAWGANNRFAGAKDRRFISVLSAEALRYRGRSRWLLGNETCRADVMGGLALGWGWTIDEVAGAFDGSRFGPLPLSADERSRLANIDFSAAPHPARFSMPEWLAHAFLTQFGAQEVVSEAEALMMRAPLDLRVNPDVLTPEALVARLEEFEAALVPGLPLSVRLPPVKDVYASAPHFEAMGAFLEGGFEVQDAGSQILAQLAAYYRPRRVLDLCAGGGGKALALKAFLGDGHDIHLYDSDARRLAGSFERLKRAGMHSFTVHEPFIRQKDRWPDSLSKAAPFDLVVVDAPCTGSGIWRRKPQTKWKLKPDFMAACNAKQIAILNSAVPLVKNGGGIAYMTCSWLSSENDDIIERFLRENRAFSFVPPDELATWPPLERFLVKSGRFNGQEERPSKETERFLVKSGRFNGQEERPSKETERFLVKSNRFNGQEERPSKETARFLVKSNRFNGQEERQKNRQAYFCDPNISGNALDNLSFWPCRFGLMLTPACSGTDGFYFAYLRRG